VLSADDGADIPGWPIPAKPLGLFKATGTARVDAEVFRVQGPDRNPCGQIDDLAPRAPEVEGTHPPDAPPEGITARVRVSALWRRVTGAL
jgi:hypothetical protein